MPTCTVCRSQQRIHGALLALICLSRGFVPIWWKTQKCQLFKCLFAALLLVKLSLQLAVLCLWAWRCPSTGAAWCCWAWLAWWGVGSAACSCMWLAFFYGCILLHQRNTWSLSHRKGLVVVLVSHRFLDMREYQELRLYSAASVCCTNQDNDIS